MTVSFDKLVEKFPAADGGFRRRLIAGALVTFSLGYIYFPDQTTSTFWSEISIKDFVTSPSVIFVAIILIYAIGGVVEMVGQLFIVRAVGEVVRFVINFFKRDKTSSAWKYYFYLPFKLVAFYFAIYFFFIKGLFGVTDYELTLNRSSLSAEGSKFYRTLPPKVRDGLAHPLGNNSDYAWEIVESRLDTRRQKLVRNRYARTKEVLIILTSIIIVMAAATPYFENILFDLSTLDSTEARTPELLFVLSLQLVGILLLLMFRGYFIILRSAIVDLIEFSASATPKTDASDSYSNGE